MTKRRDLMYQHFSPSLVSSLLSFVLFSFADWASPLSRSFHFCFISANLRRFRSVSDLFFSIIFLRWFSTDISPLISLSSRAVNISLANSRFFSVIRVMWHLTMVPVGLWRSITQLEVLLTAWPPGPLPRTSRSSKSASLIFGTLEKSTPFLNLLEKHALTRADNSDERCECECKMGEQDNDRRRMVFGSIVRSNNSSPIQ